MPLSAVISLACYTQDEIEKATGTARETVRNIVAKIETFHFWPKPGLYTEIGKAIGMSHQGVDKVSQICQETAGLPKLDKSDQAAANHATDFEVPIYLRDRVMIVLSLLVGRDGCPGLLLVRSRRSCIRDRIL